MLRSSTQKAHLVIFAGIVAFSLATVFFDYFVPHVEGLSVTFVYAILATYVALLAAVLIWILVRGIRRKIRKSPFLLFSMVTLVALPLAWVYHRSAIDWVRFQAGRFHYQAVVSQAGPSKVVVFPWGERSAYALKGYYLLVFDETGEIERPAAWRSESWEKNVVPPDSIVLDQGCASEASRLDGNFYSVYVYCRLAD